VIKDLKISHDRIDRGFFNVIIKAEMVILAFNGKEAYHVRS